MSKQIRCFKYFLAGIVSLAALHARSAEFAVARGDVAGLGAAIVQANANADCHNRIILPNGTWTLTQQWTGADATPNTGLPLVDLSRANSCSPFGGGKALEIQGAGQELTILERAPNAPRLRHFSVTPGGFGSQFGGPAGLILSDLTLRGGELFPTSVSDFCCNGGAIRNDSSDVTLNRVAILNNRAVQGGAIEVQTGRLFINDSRIDGNTSARQGGAIYGAMGGLLRIDRSSISNNIAGALLVPDSSGQGGGGILWRNDGQGEIIDSSIVGNRILFNVRSGGGIQSTGGPLDILRSELRSNEATGDGGGIQYDGAFGPTGLRNSTLSGNFAAGQGSAVSAITSPDQILFENVTIAHNEAPATGSAIRGGMDISNSLIATTRIRGSSSSAPNCGSGSTFNSLGYNLDSDGTCGLTSVGDFSSFNAADVLDPVARANGGRTLTHALVRTGLAVDRSLLGCSIGPDQRGVQRPQDGNGDGVARCDIGAYELLPLGDFTFSEFNAQLGLRSDSILMSGSFQLASGSDGVDLVSQPLTFSVADATGTLLSQTLPAGSLQRNASGQYVFRAPANAIGLSLGNIAPTSKPGEYAVNLTARRLNLSPVVSPITVKLSIGNDTGSRTISCKKTSSASQCR